MPERETIAGEGAINSFLILTWGEIYIDDAEHLVYFKIQLFMSICASEPKYWLHSKGSKSAGRKLIGKYLKKF